MKLCQHCNCCTCKAEMCLHCLESKERKAVAAERERCLREVQGLYMVMETNTALDGLNDVVANIREGQK